MAFYHQWLSYAEDMASKSREGEITDWFLDIRWIVITVLLNKTKQHSKFVKG